MGLKKQVWGTNQWYKIVISVQLLFLLIINSVHYALLPAERSSSFLLFGIELKSSYYDKFLDFITQIFIYVFFLIDSSQLLSFVHNH